MDKEILYKLFRGETTPEETKEIMDWFDADEANRREYNLAHELFNVSVLYSPGLKEKKQPAPKRRLSPRMKFAGIAAGIAAVFIVNFAISYFYVEQKEERIAQKTSRITVPAGQRINITLEDGTSVWLNSKSVLEYPVVFSKNARRVKLDGEAQFDVIHNADHPFIVETYACNVEVLGTRFNVEAYGEDDDFSTTLLSGSVKVSLRDDNGEYVVLRPQDKVELVNGHLVAQKLSDMSELRWTEGLVSFSDMTLPELLEKFERYYDVKIVNNYSGKGAGKRYSGKFWVSDGIEHALNVLGSNTDFLYTKDLNSNTIYIR